jgi:hypothetical protein
LYGVRARIPARGRAVRTAVEQGERGARPGRRTTIGVTGAVLAVVFFGLITPIGFTARLFGWDPLRRRARAAESYWMPYGTRARDHRHYERLS